MRNLFENPQVDEIFGKASYNNGQEDDEERKEAMNDEDDPIKEDEKQKSDIIRSYALNIIANIPVMFKA